MFFFYYYWLFLENIELNVGGKYYLILVLILIRELDLFFGCIFSGRYEVDKDEIGKYFIDRDGFLFRYIFDFFRINKLYFFEDF